MVLVAAVIISKDEHDLLLYQIEALRKYVDMISILIPDTEKALLKELTILKGEYASSNPEFKLEADFEPSFATRGFCHIRNIADAYIPSEYEWHLHVDTDEIFGREFLISCRKIAATNDALCYRFPRVNLPDRKNYPDYQVRFFKRENVQWKNLIPWHETLFSINEGKPLDQVSCKTLPYEIIHAPRDPKITRPWWVKPPPEKKEEKKRRTLSPVVPAVFGLTENSHTHHIPHTMSYTSFLNEGDWSDDTW